MRVNVVINTQYVILNFYSKKKLVSVHFVATFSNNKIRNVTPFIFKKKLTSDLQIYRFDIAKFQNIKGIHLNIGSKNHA